MLTKKYRIRTLDTNEVYYLNNSAFFEYVYWMFSMCRTTKKEYQTTIKVKDRNLYIGDRILFNNSYYFVELRDGKVCFCNSNSEIPTDVLDFSKADIVFVSDCSKGGSYGI